MAADSKDPTEHLMGEVEKIKNQPSERQLKWEAFKKEQKELLSKSSGSKDSAAGDRKRHPKYTGEGGGSKLTEAGAHRHLLRNRAPKMKI